MILLKNVSKSFEEKVVFKDFSLEIQDGEFVVFAGESGCGKTTLLNMIGGIEKPDHGEILVDGMNIYDKKNQKQYFREKVGFLFQNFALLEDKTVEQNLELIPVKGRSMYSMDEVLDFVGMRADKQTKVYKLSGGEQQRVALARLLMKKCDVILADEPTGSLDERNAKIVMDLLHKMNEMGKTVVVVTHNEEIIQSEKRSIRL